MKGKETTFLFLFYGYCTVLQTYIVFDLEAYVNLAVIEQQPPVLKMGVETWIIAVPIATPALLIDK